MFLIIVYNVGIRHNYLKHIRGEEKRLAIQQRRLSMVIPAVVDLWAILRSGYTSENTVHESQRVRNQHQIIAILNKNIYSIPAH